MGGWVLGHDSLSAPTGCDPGAYSRYHSEGSGQFLHLGRVTFTVDQCTVLDSATTGHAVNGVIVIVAANGDTLTLSEAATFEVDALPPTTSAIDLEWEVTSGTGRFAEAAGSGSAVGHSDFAGSWTLVDFSGWISY